MGDSAPVSHPHPISLRDQRRRRLEFASIIMLADVCAASFPPEEELVVAFLARLRPPAEVLSMDAVCGASHLDDAVTARLLPDAVGRILRSRGCVRLATGPEQVGSWQKVGDVLDLIPPARPTGTSSRRPVRRSSSSCWTSSAGRVSLWSSSPVRRHSQRRPARSARSARRLDVTTPVETQRSC